jgi:hypothetical protein
MPFKYWLPTLLVTLCTASLTAQDSIGIPEEIAAEKLFDLKFSGPKRDSIISGLEDHLHLYQYLHAHNLNNNIPLSLNFDPLLPGTPYERHQSPLHWDIPAETAIPANRNDLAFYSIPEMASLLKRRKITSVELTKFFIARLKKYGPILHCVIELTEDSAMAQARWADSLFAKGIVHSPLQGIPYGIKDLFAVKGSHTTWGTPPYKDQVINTTSYVAERLDDAGAVLIAKLSLGELAMDDIWFGGLTRNPWNLATGSGGSSAGSLDALWRHRPQANLRQHQPHRLHGIVLELGQSRTHLPQRRRCRLCLCLYPWG